MTLNPNSYPSVYDEIRSFYPEYLKKVREIDEIIRTFGFIGDDITTAIEIILNNNFILSADERMITKLERFIGITEISPDINARRQSVLSYFVGFGKISSSLLKEIIAVFADSDADISFNQREENGSYILVINISKNEKYNADYNRLYSLLLNRIPAHIKTRLIVTYPAIPIDIFVGMAFCVGLNYQIECEPFDVSSISVLTYNDNLLYARNEGILIIS